jgi:hypothetical protein
MAFLAENVEIRDALRTRLLSAMKSAAPAMVEQAEPAVEVAA